MPLIDISKISLLNFMCSLEFCHHVMLIYKDILTL